MNIKLITAPTKEPISVQDVKDHSVIDSTEDDNYIYSLIQAARLSVENTTRRSIMTQTLEAKMDSFPQEIILPNPPLQSITSIKYIDIDGVEQTLSTDVYTVDTYREPGRVFLSYDQSWPSVRSIKNAVTVRYVAGYSSSTNVPSDIKHAIKMLVAHFHENREATSLVQISELPLALQFLLTANRIHTF